MMHGGMLFGSLAWSFALLVLVLLDVRLARGEIDAEEYDRLRTELTGRSHEVPRRDG
jgi:hypothetical protein